jgi:hypothetical protein
LTIGADLGATRARVQWHDGVMRVWVAAAAAVARPAGSNPEEAVEFRAGGVGVRDLNPEPHGPESHRSPSS